MKAVLYLRSSKDRHDVSIDVQREELVRLAAARRLDIVAEFADVVESAKDEHRPAFQDLRAALKSPARDWTVVLLLEPSRLSRNQYVAHWFTHDARQNGCAIVYARMPERRRTSNRRRSCRRWCATPAAWRTPTRRRKR